MTRSENERPHVGLQNLASAATCFMALISYFTLSLAFKEAHESRQDSRERREHERKMLEATHDAFLAFDRMSNYVSIQKTQTGWDINRLPDGSVGKQHPMFPTIRNFGPGLALNCSMEYEIAEINGARLKAPEVTVTMCSPMNILPNGDCHVYAIPKCIANDKDEVIRIAKGYIKFTFNLADGTRKTSSQELLVQPEYGGAQSRLYVNLEGPKFLDHSAGW